MVACGRLRRSRDATTGVDARATRVLRSVLAGCDVCGVNCSSNLVYEEHMRSPRHARMSCNFSSNTFTDTLDIDFARREVDTVRRHHSQEHIVSPTDSSSVCSPASPRTDLDHAIVLQSPAVMPSPRISNNLRRVSPAAVPRSPACQARQSGVPNKLAGAAVASSLPLQSPSSKTRDAPTVGARTVQSP